MMIAILCYTFGSALLVVPIIIIPTCVVFAKLSIFMILAPYKDHVNASEKKCTCYILVNRRSNNPNKLQFCQ